MRFKNGYLRLTSQYLYNFATKDACADKNINAKSIENAYIIHYCGALKPSDERYRELGFSQFWKYAKRIYYKAYLRVSAGHAFYVIGRKIKGLCVLADPLIRVVLTEKWLPSVPFLQLACISYAILPLNNTNVQAIKAMGKGATYLRIEMLKKIFGIFVIIVCAQISVMAVAISAVSIAFIYLLINVIPNGRLLGYGLRDQLIDVIPFAIYSLIMGMVVYFVGMMFSYSSIVSLLVQIVVGVLVYFGMAVVDRNKGGGFFWNTFCGMILRR